MTQATSRFDQMFSALIDADPPAERPTPARAPASTATPASVDAVEDQVRKALLLFHGGRYAHCLSAVRKLEAIAAEDPRVAALEGACSALVSGRLRPGIERCAELIQQTFYLPDLYCALGVLLLKARRRAQAYQVFRKGLRIDPQHPALHDHLHAMGLRRPPVLRFLDRTHPANRTLGHLRARLARAA